MAKDNVGRNVDPIDTRWPCEVVWYGVRHRTSDPEGMIAMVSASNHVRNYASSLRVRGATLALAIVASICCNFGPAWSPDGKSVVYLYPVAPKVMKLAKYDVGARSSATIRVDGNYTFFRPFYAADGTLFAAASREEMPVDGGESDETKAKKEKYVDFLRFDDNAARVLFTGSEEEDESSLFGVLFHHDHKVWSWLNRPGVELPPEHDGDDDDDVVVRCVDDVSGEVTFPFGERRSIAPVPGRDGLFYVAMGPAGDVSPDTKLQFGRVAAGTAGTYTAEPLWFSEPGAKFGTILPLVVGNKIAVILLDRPPVTTISEGDESVESTEESDAKWCVVVDLEGTEVRRFPVSNSESTDPFAITEDRSVWTTRDDGQILSRIDVESGEVEAYELTTFGLSKEIVAMGLSASPTEPKLALQLAPKGDQPIEGQPSLLILDVSVTPPTATPVRAPK